MRRLAIALIVAHLFVGVSNTANAIFIEILIYNATKREQNQINEKIKSITRTAIALSPLVYAIDLARGKSADEAFKKRLDTLKEDIPNLVAPIDIPAKAYLLKAQIDAVEEVLGNDTANIFAFTQAPLMLIERLKQLPRAQTEYLISVFEDLDNVENFPGILLATDLFAAIDYFEHEAKLIPQPIRGYLACHFSDHTLNRARYVVNDDPTTLNGTINWIQMVVGDSSVDNHAVVSGNIIVFARMPKLDDEDFHFWAHEVTHTVQYDKWGIAGFSKQYMLDHNKVEQAADIEAETAYSKFVKAGKKAC